MRKLFPFTVIEDTDAGVCWGAQLAWSGSSQMEITRRGHAVSLSGGLADYEFGHRRKTLAPEETFTTPVAHLACVADPIYEPTHRLVRLQGAASNTSSSTTAGPSAPPTRPCSPTATGFSIAKKFPRGMKALADELRAMGFIPGVWFEFEVCNPGSKVYGSRRPTTCAATGRPLRVGSRCFWDLNDPWVTACLDERLVSFLRDNGLG